MLFSLLNCMETHAMSMAESILPSDQTNLTTRRVGTYIIEYLQHVFEGIAQSLFLINVRKFFRAVLKRSLKENGFVALIFEQKLPSTVLGREICRVTRSAALRLVGLLLVIQLTVYFLNYSVVKDLVSHLHTIICSR
jgi:hypothetical protein